MFPFFDDGMDAGLFLGTHMLRKQKINNNWETTEFSKIFFSESYLYSRSLCLYILMRGKKGLFFFTGRKSASQKQQQQYTLKLRVRSLAAANVAPPTFGVTWRRTPSPYFRSHLTCHRVADVVALEDVAAGGASVASDAWWGRYCWCCKEGWRRPFALRSRIRRGSCFRGGRTDHRRRTCGYTVDKRNTLSGTRFLWLASPFQMRVWFCCTQNTVLSFQTTWGSPSCRVWGSPWWTASSPLLRACSRSRHTSGSLRARTGPAPSAGSAPGSASGRRRSWHFLPGVGDGPLPPPAAARNSGTLPASSPSLSVSRLIWTHEVHSVLVSALKVFNLTNSDSRGTF